MWAFLAAILFALLVVQHFRTRRALGHAAAALASRERELAAARDRQEELREQYRAHERGVFNSMVEGILILDAGERIVTINESLARLFSITRPVEGLPVMEAIRSHELSQLVERVQKEGQVRSFEFTLPGIHHSRHFEVNAGTIKASGDRVQGTILIFHDFTRIKQLESVRKEFVANVSHELRTPLTSIKGYVETLLDGARDDPAVAGKFLHTIQKHTNRLAFLIEDLLTLSHLESGQAILHRELAPLRALVERVLDDLQSPALGRKISLENQVDEALQVNADKERLQQVLYNLVDNAIKYGPPGGHVRIGAREKDGFLEVQVADDGPGIPADARERIFERFFRVDRARSREAGGTGLGLAIVKHIVQTHGGKVWVESGEGQGSIFRFTLPSAPPSRRS